MDLVSPTDISLKKVVVKHSNSDSLLSYLILVRGAFFQQVLAKVTLRNMSNSDVPFVTNMMRKHCVTEKSQVDSFFRELATNLSSRRDGGNVNVIRFAGFGSRMNSDHAMVEAEHAMNKIGVDDDDLKILCFDGDFYNTSSFTGAIHRIWSKSRGTTIMVAVRGPHAKNHAGFFDSWAGIPIYLLEITEEMRTESLEKVKVLVGPNSSVKPELQIADENELENVKLGYFCMTTLPIDYIVSIGGGVTTANEGRVYLAHNAVNPDFPLPKWTVGTAVDRSGQSSTSDRESADPFLFKLELELKSE